MKINTLKKTRLETLTPEADGVETDFHTSRPYRDYSVSVWMDGLRLRPDWDDGYELPGGTIIRMKVAPRLETTLEAEYDPR